MADYRVTDRRGSNPMVVPAAGATMGGGSLPSPDLRELGLPGTKVFAGFLSEEDNPALAGDNKFPIYKTMGYDPTIAMTLKAVELPQRSTRWRFEPGTDHPDAVELADFAHYNFYDFGSMSFDDLIRLGVQGRDQYGFAAFEICWRYDDETGKYPGKVCIDKFAWRAQNTRYKWNVEEVDRPDGSRVRELVSWTQHAPPSYQYVTIPRDKLLLLVRDQTGENFEGTPLLRATWKPWSIRDRLLMIQAVGLERAYMGIPHAKLPLNYNASMQSLAQHIVNNLRTHEQAGFTTREDIDIGVLFNKLEGRAMQDAIEWLTHQIPLATLAQFTLLGSGNVGSFALSENQSDLFLMLLNAECNYFAETINLWPVMPQLIAMNYGQITREMLPRLDHGNVGERNLEKMGRTLAALFQWGGITPDDSTEDALREMLGLPERDNTITPEYLKALVELVSPTDDQLEGARQHNQPRMPLPAATNPAAQGPVTAQQLAAAEVWGEATGRMPWRRARSKGGRLVGEDRTRALAAETILTLAEEMRPSGSKPELPSLRLAKTRRAYKVRGHHAHMAEQKPGTISRPEQVAQQHVQALRDFMRARSRQGLNASQTAPIVKPTNKPAATS